jgi:steroid 5-alpha reductase family enzyme
MPAFLSVLPLTLGAVALLFLAVWVLSVLRRDASVVDVLWGLGFVFVALVAYAACDTPTPRARLVLSLTALWGVRLALYLSWRNAGQGEDFRYGAMRRRHGARFALVSLYSVFALQAALCFVISLPVQAAIVSPVPATLGSLDALGSVLFGVGFFFESVGDLQLARFKADPLNRGRVMDRGLWALTRHPNYFGDTLVWWGLFSLALSTPLGLFTLPAPLLMNFLLLRVSGVPLLERSLVKRRPEYKQYMERTSAFFPRLPRRSGLLRKG